MIEAVVFDYGGVLATSQWDAFADLQARLGPDIQLGKYFGLPHPELGTPAWLQCEIGAMAWADFADLVVAEAERDGVTLLEAHHLDQLMPLGARWPMIHRVRRLKDEGYRRAILTNNVREFQPYWHATIPMDLFELVVDSCEEGIAKPDPEIYRRTAERLGLAPSACVFLDDSAANVDAARALGMQGVVVGADIDAAIAELDGLLATARS